MRNRVVWFLVGIVLVFVLALMGIGYVVVSMHGGLRVNGMAQASILFPLSGYIHYDAGSFGKVPMQVLTVARQKLLALLKLQMRSRLLCVGRLLARMGVSSYFYRQ